jgi:CDGSH-type Zn-finger protein
MADVSIKIFDNGPIEVIGPVTLVNEADEPLATEEGEPIYFCRCGQSEGKPYCDGSHDTCGFVSKLTS